MNSQNVKGRAAYFLRKSAKLTRQRAKPKEYEANYDMLREEDNALEAQLALRQHQTELDRNRNAYMEEQKDYESSEPLRRVIHPELDTSQIERFARTHSQ